VVLEGVVDMAGFGTGIRTWDTFASSKTSRWGHIRVLDGGPGLNEVMAVEVVGGDLYSAGPYGLDRMVGDGPDPDFETIDGGPGTISSLEEFDGWLLAGAEDGLWAYSPITEDWTDPAELSAHLPHAPIGAQAVAHGYSYVAIEGSLNWGQPGGYGISKVLSTIMNITALGASRERGGPVWAVMDGDLHAYVQSDARESFVVGRELMGDSVVRDVEVVDDGTAFVATDSGLHRIGPYQKSWTDWTTSNGLSANDLRDIELQPGTDMLWTCAYGGVDIVDTKTGWPERPSNLVYDVMIVDGDVWVGTDVGGAGRKPLAGSTWQTYNSSTGLVADDVHALAKLGDHVLFGTDSGVTVLDLASSTFTTHTLTSTTGRLPDDWVWCALASGTEFYVGTAMGLGVYDPESGLWSEAVAEEVADVAVRSLAWDDDGRLWVGTDNRIVVLPGAKGGPTMAIDRSDGLPGDQVLSLTLDSDNMMWAGTSAGAGLVDMEWRAGSMVFSLAGTVLSTTG
jgi:hypothetical protein